MPNLASRSLGLEGTAGTLARAAWLADVFTDIERSKAPATRPTSPSRLFPTAWPPQKALDRLNRNALRILTAMDVPKAYQSALNHDTPERDLALRKTQMESLLKHFREHFEDPRRTNRS